MAARAMKICIEEIEADPSSSNAHFLTPLDRLVGGFVRVIHAMGVLEEWKWVGRGR